jgi:hypothetical protein
MPDSKRSNKTLNKKNTSARTASKKPPLKNNNGSSQESSPASSSTGKNSELYQQKLEIEIEILINQNKRVLERAYHDYAEKLRRSNDLIDENIADNEKSVRKFNEVEAYNKNAVVENDRTIVEFNEKQSLLISSIELEITSFNLDINNLQANEIEVEVLPTAQEISQEIKDDVSKFNETKELQTKAKGVNENNKLKLAQCEIEMDDLRSIYSTTFEEIAKVQGEIDEYLLKVKNTLAVCFEGDFKIDFEFYERTIAGEYKETFRMLIDGKEFKNMVRKPNS